MPGPSRFNSLVPLSGNNRGPHGLAYDPSHCETIRALAQEGRFPEEWCAQLGVASRTLNYWANKYPEFEAAVEIAWHILAAVHADRLAKLIMAGEPTARVQFQVMERRFSSAWRPGTKATLEGFLARNDPDPNAGRREGLKTTAEIKAAIEVYRKRREHDKEKDKG